MADDTDIQVDIRPEFEKRLACYKDLSFAEQFAMFMGKAQLLELGLKGVLASKFGYDFDKMERWTLGQVRRELETVGVRPDFLALLKAVVEKRNFIAHEILAAEAMVGAILGEGNQFTKNHRELSKAVYELEQLILHFDLNQEHDAWMPVENGSKDGVRSE
jgi:hypothetical protein